MKRFVQSPCGHGLLFDVEPYEGEAVDGQAKRWGLIAIVLRTGGMAYPVPCCSHAEGEYETREAAAEAARAEKQYHQDRLDEALGLLDQLGRDVLKVGGVRLNDLFELRQHLDSRLVRGERPCSEPLCHEDGRVFWLVDEERDRLLCLRHLDGLRIYDHETDSEKVFRYSPHSVPGLFSAHAACRACGQAVPVDELGFFAEHEADKVEGLVVGPKCPASGKRPSQVAVES